LNDEGRFIRSVEWDEDDDIRISALSSAGNYLKSVENPNLLRVVFEAFLDDHANEVLQESAYCALAIAYEDYQADNKPNLDILKMVRNKLQLK